MGNPGSIIKSLFSTCLFLFLATYHVNGQKFYTKLSDYCSTLSHEFQKIPGERKEILHELGNYILEPKSINTTVQLLFVCSQNSRRSQFAQVWAQTASYYYKLNNIKSFSGGLNENAINYRIMEALKKAGFSVTTSEVYSKNPVYLLSVGRKYPDIFIFSKKYDYWNNPDAYFFSVYCSASLIEKGLQIPGAVQTINLPYEDIRIFDNSPGWYLRNDEICRQVAREMFYLMDYIKKIEKRRKKKNRRK